MQSESELVTTFEEAADLLKRTGVLPLAPLLPEHPSLVSVTREDSWHTGDETDPWLWRVRIPGEGIGAYGKFLKKKGLLISREWFPVFAAAAGPTRSPKERYEEGAIGIHTVKLFDLISEPGGMETRSLRAAAGLKAKENKAVFDAGLNELQGALEIVISGVKERYNAQGEKSGWNSTSFETSSRWMEQAGISRFEGSSAEAREQLLDLMAKHWSPAARAWFVRAMRW